MHSAGRKHNIQKSVAKTGQRNYLILMRSQMRAYLQASPTIPNHAVR
jgi:hypothetical protein